MVVHLLLLKCSMTLPEKSGLMGEQEREWSCLDVCFCESCLHTKMHSLNEKQRNSYHDQCDQMVESKVAQISPKLDQKSSHSRFS